LAATGYTKFLCNELASVLPVNI